MEHSSGDGMAPEWVCHLHEEEPVHGNRRADPATAQGNRLVPGRTRRQDRHRLPARQPLRDRQDHAVARRHRPHHRGTHISIDHLLIDDIPRRPPHPTEHNLGDRLRALSRLSEDDLTSLLHMLDALVAEKSLKTLAEGIS